MWVSVWFNGVHSLVLVYSLSSTRVMMEVKALREDNKCQRKDNGCRNERDIFPKVISEFNSTPTKKPAPPKKEYKQIINSKC